MDIAEFSRRALEHRLREAFARPGAGKPHEIEIPTACETLWSFIANAVRALAAPVDADGLRFEGVILLDETTKRRISFHLQPERRLLVATCLG
ncbi:MAG: hypothetical protein NUW08_04060 [Candidatus Uhrbacteria bacterium]|nr:hypothetical protein [Candidatus Uhrbacteria bacterium]